MLDNPPTNTPPTMSTTPITTITPTIPTPLPPGMVISLINSVYVLQSMDVLGVHSCTNRLQHMYVYILDNHVL